MSDKDKNFICKFLINTDDRNGKVFFIVNSIMFENIKSDRVNKSDSENLSTTLYELGSEKSDTSVTNSLSSLEI